MSDSHLRGLQRRTLASNDELEWARYVRELIRHGKDPRAVVQNFIESVGSALHEAGRNPIVFNDVHYSFEPSSPWHCHSPLCRPTSRSSISECRCDCPDCQQKLLADAIGNGVVWGRFGVYGRILLTLRWITSPLYFDNPIEKISIEISNGSGSSGRFLMTQEMRLAWKIVHGLYPQITLEHNYTNRYPWDLQRIVG